MLPNVGITEWLIVLVIFILPALVLVMAIWHLKGPGPSRPGREEQVQIEQIAASLRKIEERVTNLETILMHRTPPNVPNDDPMGKV